MNERPKGMDYFRIISLIHLILNYCFYFWFIVLVKLSSLENLNKLKELENEIKHLAKLDKINFVSDNEYSNDSDDLKFNCVRHELNQNFSIFIKYNVIFILK